MSKDLVTTLEIAGEFYHVHAQIRGGLWSGYVVHDNEYLMALPSSTHIKGLVDAAERLLETRNQKSEFQVHKFSSS